MLSRGCQESKKLKCVHNARGLPSKPKATDLEIRREIKKLNPKKERIPMERSFLEIAKLLVLPQSKWWPRANPWTLAAFVRAVFFRGVPLVVGVNPESQLLSHGARSTCFIFRDRSVDEVVVSRQNSLPGSLEGSGVHRWVRLPDPRVEELGTWADRSERAGCDITFGGHASCVCGACRTHEDAKTDIGRCPPPRGSCSTKCWHLFGLLPGPLCRVRSASRSSKIRKSTSPHASDEIEACGR